jgi:hypothetical protein
MKTIIILLASILISSCGLVREESDTPNNNLNQLEKDVNACEVGKYLYKSCTPYSGYQDVENLDNYNWDKSYTDNWKNGGISYSSEWVDECPDGEERIFFFLFIAKGYVRHQDIEECMVKKGYSYKSQKWIKK